MSSHVGMREYLNSRSNKPWKNLAASTIWKFGENANIRVDTKKVQESIIREYLLPNFPVCIAPPNEPNIVPRIMMLARNNWKEANIRFFGCLQILWLNATFSKSLKSHYTRTWCNRFWKFGCQIQKSKTDPCMINDCKVMIYLTLISFFLHYLQE